MDFKGVKKEASYSLSNVQTSDTVKVIGAGWGRTGTMSLKKALEILGYDPCYHMVESFKYNHALHWCRVVDKEEAFDFDQIFKTPEATFTATCDFPSATFWKEQLKFYPDAKVILTVRNPEKWYKSAYDTYFNYLPSCPSAPFGAKVCMYFNMLAPNFRKMMSKVVVRDSFGGDWSKEGIIKKYQQHNDTVLRECPKEKLLVYEISEGWKPLCKFLNKPIPDVPFPHVNDTKEFQQHVRFFNRLGWSIVIAVTLLVLMLVGYGMYYFYYYRITASEGFEYSVSRLFKALLYRMEL